MDGHRIRERRKGLGLSQQGLGERLDVARETVIRWELDRDRPAHPKMLDLALNDLESTQVIDKIGNMR